MKLPKGRLLDKWPKSTSPHSALFVKVTDTAHSVGLFCMRKSCHRETRLTNDIEIQTGISSERENHSSKRNSMRRCTTNTSAYPHTEPYILIYPADDNWAVWKVGAREKHWKMRWISAYNTGYYCNDSHARRYQPRIQARVRRTA